MEAFFHKHILPVSVILFLIAGVLFTTQGAAFGRPQGVGQYPPQAGTANTSGRPVATGSSTAAVIPQQGQTGISHMPPFAKIRLQDAKLRACQAISANVIARSNHLVSLVTKMEKTFTSIARGVEQYYLTKVVPTGTTLPNYDALVAEITTKENVIAPLVQTAQTNAASFSCTGNNPAAQLTQFRTDMQAVLRGLQEYRTAIKNLIVAVRTLPSITSPVTPSATPSTTLTPTVTPSVTPSVTP